ncbi:MAG: toxin HipA [Ignavibacteriae bacterium]|nr:toxin HipA [Ignavibacteriota bacterium]
MRKAKIFNFGIFAGYLIEEENKYIFKYADNYSDQPISLNIPLRKEEYIFESFPPFFDGLLPEGNQLEALLRQTKIDRNDLFSQLLTVGKDLVGSITVEANE